MSFSVLQMMMTPFSQAPQNVYRRKKNKKEDSPEQVYPQYQHCKKSVNTSEGLGQEVSFTLKVDWGYQPGSWKSS